MMTEKKWVQSYELTLQPGASEKIHRAGKAIRCIRSTNEFYVSFSNSGAYSLMREGLQYFTDGFTFFRVKNNSSKPNKLAFIISEKGVADSALSLSETLSVTMENFPDEIKVGNFPKRFESENIVDFRNSILSNYFFLRRFYIHRLIHKNENTNGIFINKISFILNKKGNNYVSSYYYPLYVIMSKSDIQNANVSNISDFERILTKSKIIKTEYNGINIDNFIIPKGYHIYFFSRYIPANGMITYEKL